MKIHLCCLIAALLFVAGGAWALDERVIRDIDRADTLSDLMTLTDDIVKAQGMKKAASTDDAVLISVDTQTYLAYIRIKLDKLMCDQLQTLIDQQPPALPNPR
jgi:hypothetical protein